MVRRLSSGISFQGSYTFSRSIDNALTPVNSYWNHRLDRGLSGFDRTHVAVMSYIWELPFFQNGTGWTRRAFGGWQFSGITRVESGNPLTIGIAGDRAGTGAGGQRPNTTGPIERHLTLERWFATAPFALPALGTFGTAGRGLVRGPGIHNWDMSFSKRTLLRENLSLQFRAEFFNIWNHTQWSGVGTTVGAGTFGQVTSARDPRITQLGLRLLF